MSLSSNPRTSPPAWTPPPSGTKFMTGALPSPRYRLMAAMPFHVVGVAPPQFGVVPSQLSMWGNDKYGDCVSAEEAFAKAVSSIMLGLPEVFIPDNVVMGWAQKRGFLNGADLTSVMSAMSSQGFSVGTSTKPQLYNDGPHFAVDYSNEATLQSALVVGPVKIAIDHAALPQTAGTQQGWHAVGGTRQYQNTDHCVGLCGYGPTSYLYSILGVPLPNGLPAFGYLLFTWSTIGFVDHNWIMSTCVESWVRTPTTVGVPPLTPPPPHPNPVPVPAGVPSISVAMTDASGINWTASGPMKRS